LFLDGASRARSVEVARRPRKSTMTDLSALVALSFLPIRLWPLVGQQLRAGHPPLLVLDRVLFEHWGDDSAKRSALDGRAAAAIDRADRTGVALILWNDPAYPPCLAAIVDPPPVLWMLGAPAAFDRPAVALVGSRAGSPYALEVAGRLAADLAARGVMVVSGLARGVDSAAHRGALSAGGTIAVLGSGVDVIYPPEHASLAREIASKGAVMSELAPGTQPLPVFFPRRNRIISGLSRAVVVIEAGEKSGALITAHCALDQGRAVLAVPGNVLSGRNRGGHALLRDGAKIVETADDILEELALPAGFPPSGPAGVVERRDPAGPVDGVEGVERVGGVRGDPVLACMPQGEPCDLDAIAAGSGLSPARLLARLFELELQGLVRRVGGGRFVRVEPLCGA
jgi:DNA processing protein